MAAQTQREKDFARISQSLEEYSDTISTHLDNLDFEDVASVYPALKHIAEEFENKSNQIGRKITLTEADRLIFRISLLKKTPPSIVNYEFTPLTSSDKIKLHETQVNNLQNYLNNFLEPIDEQSIYSLEKHEIKKINNTIKSVIYMINEILYLNAELRPGNIIDVDGLVNAYPYFKGKIDKFDDTIHESENILKTTSLLPNAQVDEEDSKKIEAQKLEDNAKNNFFSILQGIADEIKQSVRDTKESEKAAEKLVEKAKVVEQAVEDLGTEKLLDFESKYFKETADKHQIRCILFLIGAFVLGLLTIIWALGVKEIWGVKNFLISQNIECSQYTQPDFYLCKLAIFPKELLVGVVLVAGIYACLRAYFANAHSESISRHRFNSLQIYSKGRNLIDDRDRDVFVQKATEAIFEQLPTGFTKYHKDDSNKSSDINAQLALIAALTARATKGDGTSTPSA